MPRDERPVGMAEYILRIVATIEKVPDVQFTRAQVRDIKANIINRAIDDDGSLKPMSKYMKLSNLEVAALIYDLIRDARGIRRGRRP